MEQVLSTSPSRRLRPRRPHDPLDLEPHQPEQHGVQQVVLDRLRRRSGSTSGRTPTTHWLLPGWAGSRTRGSGWAWTRSASGRGVVTSAWAAGTLAASVAAALGEPTCDPAPDPPG